MLCFRAGSGLVAALVDLHLAIPRVQTPLASPGDVELVPLGVGEEIAAMRSDPAAGTARPFSGLWH